MEEARAFQELMDAEGLSAEKLGARLHISGQRVRDRLLLLTNQRVSDAVQRDQIPVTVATEILRLPDEGQRQLTPRIDAGEALDRATVRAVRDTLKTAGVANPRAKGGGRPKKGPQSPPQATTDGADYQCGIDIQGSSHPLVPLAGSFSACSARYNVRDDSSKRLLSVRNHFQRRVLATPTTPIVTVLDGLKEAVGALDTAAVIEVVRFGAAEGWSCAQLVVALEGVRDDDTP